jgi:hypothetical protein
VVVVVGLRCVCVCAAGDITALAGKTNNTDNKQPHHIQTRLHTHTHTHTPTPTYIDTRIRE